MQIHELTSGPQQTNEGVVSALAGGIAKQVGQRMLQKQGIQPDQYAGQRVGALDRSGAALKMNAPLLQQMAKKGQQAWTVTQQELAKKNNPPVASAGMLTPNELKPHLTALVDQLLGFKHTDPLSAPDSAVNTNIQLAQDAVETSIDKIIALTKETPNAQTQRSLDAAWTELTTKGIGPLQVFGQQSQSNATAAPQSGAQTLSQALGQQNMAIISKVTQGQTMNKTGFLAVDELLTAAGAKLK